MSFLELCENIEDSRTDINKHCQGFNGTNKEQQVFICKEYVRLDGFHNHLHLLLALISSILSR
jgi:hypothetical protein